MRLPEEDQRWGWAWVIEVRENGLAPWRSLATRFPTQEAAESAAKFTIPFRGIKKRNSQVRRVRVRLN